MCSKGFCSVEMKFYWTCKCKYKRACVFRVNDPSRTNIADAICMGGWNEKSWQENSEKTISFDIAFGNGEVGCLTSVSFYEKVKKITLASGGENFPRKFGLVVLKNGREIFRADNEATSLEWTLQTFDFREYESFCYSGTTNFTFQIQAFDPQFKFFSSIWELDDIS